MRDLVESRSASLPWGFLVVTTSLMAIGLVAVASATSSLDRPFWTGVPWRTPFGRQTAFLVVGVGVLLMSARISVPMLATPRVCRWLPLSALAVTVALLGVALIPGVADARHGSQRWLRLPTGLVDLSFQPSEMAKITLVMFLAWWLGSPQASPRTFLRGLVVPGVILALLVGLVGKEDFGTAALLAGVGGLLLVVAGCRWLHLIPLSMLGMIVLAALLYNEPYRMERLRAHGDMWNDMRGAGYQPVQSLVTIASGGWFGEGLGVGVQKFGYLPESHTDFIFSVICEEAGLLGGGLILLLFSAFMGLGLRTVAVAATPFERLLAFGLTAMIGLQAAMNIAVVTAVTPTKGISLPLISAGGSGTLTYCLAIGLLVGIATRANARSVEPEGVGSKGGAAQPGTA